MYLTAAGWSSGPVRVATSFRQQWRGLRPRPQGVGLLVGGDRVHGRGMAEPLEVAGLSARGQVLQTARLRPGRFLRIRDAVMILELPLDRSLPPVGCIVEVVRVPT